MPWLCLIYFPALVYLPLICIPLVLLACVANYYKLYSLSRAIVASAPLILASVFQAYLSKKGLPVIPSVASLILSFTFLPYVIYDFKEKTPLYFFTFFSLVLLVSTNWLNDLLELSLDTEIIETGWLAYVTSILSLVSGGTSIFVLVQQNILSENKTHKLLALSEKGKDNKIIAQEQELRNYLNEIKEKQLLDDRRNWMNEGISKCLILIRKQESV